MLNQKYYEGYEGEAAVKVWREDNLTPIGMIIWCGFFETILEGCFVPDFPIGGISECYYYQNGFYDEKWEMANPSLVAQELSAFHCVHPELRNTGMIQETNEVLQLLKGLIATAVEKQQKVYIECL